MICVNCTAKMIINQNSEENPFPMWLANCFAIDFTFRRLILRRTVVSTAPANFALTEPENDPPVATASLTWNLISLILMRPLIPNLAMALEALSPTAKAACTPLKACSAPFTATLAALTAADNGTRPSFAASSVCLAVLTTALAAFSDAWIGFFKA